MVGRNIAQYRVLARLGHGGMGTVYHATDEMLEREVALKVLDGEHEDPQKRFRAEAIALARLNHPGIATVYELFQHEGRWVMVMEFVRGQTLQQIVEQIGVFSPQRAAELCMQALGALAHAHSAGVVHRDLKPSNLMITETGAVKIMDFGIARLDGTEHLTNGGLMLGTPAYMAPEQVQGHGIDARADLYAMGVVFYRLVSAALPFQGETPFAMAQSQVNDPPTPIDLVRSDLPPWVHQIVTRALAKAPEQRFQSAIEFHEGFLRCLAGLPLVSAGSVSAVTEVMARPSSTVSTRVRQPLTPAVGRRRVAAWIAIVGAAISIGGIGTNLWLRWPLVVSPRNGEAPAMLRTAPADTGSATGATPRRDVVANGSTSSARFSNVKVLVVNGGRTDDVDVRLSFSNAQIQAVPDGGSPIAAVPYRRIAKATYVHALDPEWDPRLSAPTEKINVPGFLGRSRHWLVVQTKETYLILRLDEDWPDILRTFEAHTGVTINRR